MIEFENIKDGPIEKGDYKIFRGVRGEWNIQIQTSNGSIRISKRGCIRILDKMSLYKSFFIKNYKWRYKTSED